MPRPGGGQNFAYLSFRPRAGEQAARHLALVPDRIHRMEIVCPYCGETIAVFIDEGGGPIQRYVEDCSVCCRPIELSVDETENGDFSIVAVRGDE
jgi:cysteine-rich CPXCG protein